MTIGSGATLTGNGTAGAITLSGGTVTQSGGTLTLTSIIGNGAVNGTITNAAITAKSGTLTLAGSLGGSSTLAIDSSAAANLTIAGTVTSGAIAINSSNQTLQVGAAGNLTISAAESITNGNIVLSGGTLNDTLGVTLGSGAALSGQGTVNASLSGTGTVTASGGTLELSSAVSGGSLALAVGSGSSDRLLLDGGSSASSLTFSGSTGTLELNTAGTLTLANALSVGANTLKLDGASSQLTDNAGISLSTGTITGLGKVTGAITATGAAAIIASSGTLELASAASGANLAMTAATSTDTLKLDAAGNQAHTLSLDGGTLLLNGNTASLTIGTQLAIGSGTVNLAGTGATLTDASGVTLGSGAISGFGAINADLSGAGSVTAAGGMLDLTGTVNSGLTLSIADVQNSTLKIDGTATTGAITIDTANKTLEIGVSGKSLTLSAAESVTNGGTIRLDGGALSDTNASGITVGSGGTLIGAGAVNGSLAGSGAIEATGGTLDLTGSSVAASATGLTIANDGSTLAVDNVANGADVTFLGGSGTLKVLHVSDFFGTISGLTESTGLTPTNDVDLADVGTVTRSTISGNVVTFFNGSNVVATLNLASPPAAGSHADWIGDGATGNDVFLSDVPCFCAGTRIRTDCGEVAVEDLKVGDRVDTLFRGFRPIRWIGVGRSLVTPFNREKVRPVIVRRGAVGENEPCRDLYLTKGHCLLVDGHLVPADLLVNHRTIEWDDRARVVEYYHIELDEHDVLFAEGTLAESYIDDGNRELFQNIGDKSDKPPMRRLAPVLAGGPELDRIWAMLVDRAGGPVEVETTDDPDLHLIVDGRRVDPVAANEHAYTFTLDRRPSSLRVRSRSMIPAALGRKRDGRKLGVAITHLVLTQAGVTTKIGCDGDLFPEGCYPLERGFRWTNGDLAFAPRLLAQIEGEVTLEVHLMHRLQYPVPTAGCESDDVSEPPLFARAS